MKDFLFKNKVHFGIIAVFVILYLLGSGWEWMQSLSESFTGSLLDMIGFLPAIFLLIGLVDAWVPKETVTKHTGENSGWISSLWMILLATLQAGPLYGTFPVAYLMWKKGTSVRNIFIYIGAFSTIKLPLIGFEMAFLGVKFSLLRTMISIPVFLGIAWIMDRMFRKDFVIYEGNRP